MVRHTHNLACRIKEEVAITKWLGRYPFPRQCVCLMELHFPTRSMYIWDTLQTFEQVREPVSEYEENVIEGVVNFHNGLLVQDRYLEIDVLWKQYVYQFHP